MKDTFVEAKLIDWDTVRIALFSAARFDPLEIRVAKDGIPSPRMKPTKISSLGDVLVADFALGSPLELGHSYFVLMASLGSVPLNVDDAPSFHGFDERFSYDGEDLGSSYEKTKTAFALWAPISSSVTLCYRESRKADWKQKELVRDDRGVFRGEILGDLRGVFYRYRVKNSEVVRETTDAYAKASTQNGEDSVVVDPMDLVFDFKKGCLPKLKRPTDAVLYEAHVRDLTIDPASDVRSKGTFDGLAEVGRRSGGGNPVGLDYLKGLGITHLQLLPVFDFKTMDERDPSRRYNWGYDPAQYFVPEGCYAKDLGDPFSRIKGLQKLVARLHTEGIRVVFDVVFNHVYDAEDSVFERIVPNYYFRKRRDGKNANTSGCGNDLASERPMVRKLILDACRFYIDSYGADGFRFDLMGILDCETLRAIRAMAASKDPSFLTYGEGWNMGGEARVPLGHMGNQDQLPGFSFFNDCFRERAKEYFCGELSALAGVKFASLGSAIPVERPALFVRPIQSINYVECHDNATFFDFLSKRRSDLSEKEKLDSCLASACFVLFSFGIPFLHMGEEVGLSKKGEENTYNKGDAYNAFSDAALDERKRMYDVIQKAISLRKEMDFLHEEDPSVIAEAVDCSDWFGAYRLRFLSKEFIAPRKALEFYFNPTDVPINLPEDAPKKILFCSSCEEDVKGPRLLPPRSAFLLED